MENFTPQTQYEHLALLIARAFDDEAQLEPYLVYCKKYPTAVIRQAFNAARDFPEEKIKKSRAAIFFYLVKRYAHES